MRPCAPDPRAYRWRRSGAWRRAQTRRATRWLAIIGGVALVASCGAPPSRAPLPPGAFAFGVFGDAPYSTRDVPEYRRVLAAVNASDVTLLLHVGDLLNGPCDDAVIQARASELRALRPAVIYTPGDNEWADCHREKSGRYRPLERLAFLRGALYPEPGRSLGTAPLALESQASDSTWADMVENRRWRIGHVVFATLHLVGSGNATEDFKGRTAADDSAAGHRMAAALAWLDTTYAQAAASGAKAVVLAFHANIGFTSRRGVRDGFESFVPRLRAQAAAFPGRTLVIHGDTHEYHYDQALTDSIGVAVPRAWRLETWGSPTVGWVRVVMDSVSGDVLAVESRP